MPFILSVPKARTSLPHRKVTVESVTGDGLCFNMKELLLASGAEPKDVLPAFGFDSLQLLMQLARIWDVIETMYASDPTTFEDCEEPILKMCQHLLVKKVHPATLCRSSNVQAIKHLLELQINWTDIKENYKVAELTCDFCGCTGPVLRCSGCMVIRKEVRYCNKECQTAGWKQHKKDGCGRYASEGAKQRVGKACADSR
jgi:hypothetical protein